MLYVFMTSVMMVMSLLDNDNAIFVLSLAPHYYCYYVLRTWIL